MSPIEARTPSSTSGSSAGSPPPSAIHPETPLSAGFPNLPTDGENNQSASGDASAPAPGTNGGNTKRKANRRANTAERRATHNAVERARRETLNGRFLDLAALLPQLATVRRPSKSAIVNSSIAIIHQARRTRLIAARELRLLRSEADALRRENNEWRSRAGIPRNEEPNRSPEFMNLINPQETEGSGGNGWDNEALGEMGEEERKAYELALNDKGDDDMEDGEDDFSRMKKPAANMPSSGPITNAQMAVYNQQQQQQQAQTQVPRQAQQTAIPQPQPTVNFNCGTLGGFDMPSHPNLSSGVQTMYEPNGLSHGASHSLPVHPDFQMQQFAQQARAGQDKFNGWDASQLNLFSQQSQQVPSQWAHQLAGGPGSFTPPGSARAPGSPMNGAPFFMQQQQQATQIYHASPDVDDSSSVGSGEHITGTGSASGSPGPFETGLMNVNTGGAMPIYGRRPSLSLSLPSNGWQTQQLQPGRQNPMLSMMM